MASRDAKLLAEVRALEPQRGITDAVLATRAVGWVRVAGALAGLVVLGLAWTTDSWAGALLGAIVIFGVPALSTYSRPPVVLALAGHDALVFGTTRIRHRPDRLVDTIPAASLEIDFPGALSDKWRVGERKIGIYRGERSRLQDWAEHPSMVR